MLRPTPVTASVKFGCMLGTPLYPTLLAMCSENVLGDADNQQGSRSVAVTGLTPQRLHAELLAANISVSRAYLLGALHDATISKLHWDGPLRTVRRRLADRRRNAVSGNRPALMDVPRGQNAQPVDPRDVGQVADARDITHLE